MTFIAEPEALVGGSTSSPKLDVPILTSNEETAVSLSVNRKEVFMNVVNMVTGPESLMNWNTGGVVSTTTGAEAGEKGPVFPAPSIALTLTT